MEINQALRTFEATQANIAKLERVLGELDTLRPVGIVFGSSAKYDDRARTFQQILEALPKINGWKPDALPLDLDELAQMRLDAHEVGEIEAQVAVEKAVEEPAKQIALYKHKLNSKRRPLIRRALEEIVQHIDSTLESLESQDDESLPVNRKMEGVEWNALKGFVAQINVLLGDSLPRPTGWTGLQRHLYFEMVQDLRDILRLDWPQVKVGLISNLYADDEPIPVDVEDLGVLAEASPTGPVISKLSWEHLSDEDFERLMFSLLGSSDGYQNPEWLTSTHASDRGRDLSVTRIVQDTLGGITRQRVIVQCKHWLSRSVSVADVGRLKEQMQLWTSPRVDVLVIATTGRFTTDAVQNVENHNQSDRALKIEMWADSKLERILAERPDLIAEFRLR